MTSPTSEKTSSIRAAFAQHVARVREDRTLSDVGRIEKIKTLYQQHRAELDRLRDDLDTAISTRRTKLTASLLHRTTIESLDSSSVIAYRDAGDRAARVTEEADAVLLLASAIDNSDTALQKALLARAYDQQWADVVNTYTANWPTREKDVEELWHIRLAEGQEGQQRSMKQIIAEQELWDLNKPAELDMTVIPTTTTFGGQPVANQSFGGQTVYYDRPDNNDDQHILNASTSAAVAAHLGEGGTH